MVVDDHAEVVGEPADDFRVQRLAGAADDAQLALDRLGEFVATGDQQAISGGRTGEVGDAVFVDHPAGAFEGERPIVESDWMAHRQRPGDAEVDAVGPTRIGDVPEGVFGTQVYGIAGVTLERDDGFERYRQRFRRAGGAGREHQQKRIFASQQYRFADIGIIGQFGPEAEVATDDALAFRAANGNEGRAVSDFGEFRPVDRIGDHNFGAGAVQAMFEGLGAEGGEQWLIHRADAPGGEHGDEQFDVARQQAGDLVTLLHALGEEEVGETRGFVLELAEGVRRTRAVAAFPEQRNAPGQGMTVATFDAGVERRQRTAERGIHGVLIVELFSGRQVIAHCQNPSVFLLGWEA
ncbi:hypothetical protein D3C73_208370 [compost metagenome]